jgi:uncharacterized membrane protein
MPQTWIERLFKFNGLQFAEGEIGWQAGAWFWPVVGLLVLLGVVFVVAYTATRLFTSTRAKAFSLSLRIAALALLGLPLLEPMLITPDVVPEENFVAVLVDASESMTIPDAAGGRTRFDEALSVLDDDSRGIAPGLEEHFKVRYYAFGDRIQRVDSVSHAAPEQDGTDLSGALDRVLSDFRGVPLAGVVLMTDGGDNSDGVPLNEAEALRARDVPLHIVGLGQPAFAQDRELLDASVTRSVEETTGAEIEVKVRSWAAEPEPVAFHLFQGEERVFSDARRLKGGGKVDQFTFFYEPATTEAREYTLTVEEAPAEQNTANNALHVLIDTRQDTIRVLYIDGHLRPEFKFSKRAMEDDRGIEVASVARTGPAQFYRQGVTSPDQLLGGFPRDRKEMFAYHAVILGDIEAGAFALDQLELLEAFVRVRGGGFLMVGGAKTYAEGDYWNTRVSDMLPIEIDPGRRFVVPPSFGDVEGPPNEQGFRFIPTAVGLDNPILKLSPDPDQNRLLWDGMPGLTSLNFLGRIKPGAVVLAEKPDDTFGASEPLFAIQRYGRGRTAALATASTWRWQMHLEAEDRRHERFWRQLVRWLVASAPAPVDVAIAGRRFAPGDEVPVTVRLYDPDFNPVDDAQVTGFVRDPYGAEQPVVFQSDLAEAGAYMATYVPADIGVYELDVEAASGDSTLRSRPQSFLVRSSQKEFFDATLKQDALQRLARASDGLYYEPADVAAIPANLRGRRTSASVYHAEYLWDMPALWGLILLLLCLEWVWRRRQGMP